MCIRVNDYKKQIKNKDSSGRKPVFDALHLGIIFVGGANVPLALADQFVQLGHKFTPGLLPFGVFFPIVLFPHLHEGDDTVAVGQDDISEEIFKLLIDIGLSIESKSPHAHIQVVHVITEISIILHELVHDDKFVDTFGVEFKEVDHHIPQVFTNANQAIGYFFPHTLIHAVLSMSEDLGV